jgi:hypothetical protein
VVGRVGVGERQVAAASWSPVVVEARRLSYRQELWIGFPLEGATPSWCWSLVGGLEEALTVGADHLLEVVKGAFDGVDSKAHLGPLDG